MIGVIESGDNRPPYDPSRTQTKVEGVHPAGADGARADGTAAAAGRADVPGDIGRRRPLFPIP